MIRTLPRRVGMTHGQRARQKRADLADWINPRYGTNEWRRAWWVAFFLFFALAASGVLYVWLKTQHSLIRRDHDHSARQGEAVAAQVLFASSYRGGHSGLRLLGMLALHGNSGSGGCDLPCLRIRNCSDRRLGFQSFNSAADDRWYRRKPFCGAQQHHDSTSVLLLVFRWCNSSSIPERSPRDT